MTMPSAYDATKGWDETLSWVPESVRTIPVSVVPHSGSVVVMQGASDGYMVQVRAADSGQVRWSSKPWNPPAPMAGAEGSSEDGKAAEIPDVTGVEQDGHSYVVAYAHGMRGKDDLHEGTEVVRLAVYPADASGSSVKPLREIDVPVSAAPGEVRVHERGGRLLVGWGEGGAFPHSSAAVDVATGSITAYKDANQLLPQCERAVACSGSRVMAATPDGPLVAMGGGGFGIPGRWFSDAVRPAGVAAQAGVLDSWNGSVGGVADRQFLAVWHTNAAFDEKSDPVWSVHDLGTGKLRASMVCGEELPDSLTSTHSYPLISSPGGRYLAAGPLAFDLERKKGICLKGDGNRKTILVSSIRDDGTAYGVVEEEPTTSDSKPVVAQLDLSTVTGKTKVLGTGVDVPYHTSVNGSGLFITRDGDKIVRVSLRAGR
ncbi:hypothetical protein ACFVT2_10955 [Streptomyces sp. NPDC058000]|uniref:hypothetical protein n=1 Tax=Streptomyces sp. NPDC058000 TaxID=3346299 RepID=UPI0036E36C65